MSYLFLYGTLISGHAHPSILVQLKRHCRDLGRAWAQGRLYDLGEYPGMVESGNSSDRVYGRLYEAVSHERHLITRLDRYENYFPSQPNRSEYLRKHVTVINQNTCFEAWTYLYHRSVRNLIRIKNGDYIQHRKNSNNRI